MSFDTSRPSAAQACDDGAVFEPVYPGTETGIGATIVVRGPRSAAVREYARQKYAKAQAKEQAARKAGKFSEDTPELDEIDESLTEMALVYTIGWTGMDKDGAALEFSPAAARYLYTAHPWLREQVIAEGQDLGKFVRPSAKSSTNTPGPSSS
jgi:hypothetical protein